ncbi:MAG: hypothetical protein ABW128_13355 [Rhizorhabdus sp.]
MDPVYFVMAILGCSDDGMACRQARIEPVRYENAAKCQAAIDSVLPRQTDLDFPMVGASCQAQGGRVADRHRATPQAGG